MDFKALLGSEVAKIDAAIIAFLDGRTYAKEDAFVSHYYQLIKDYIMAGGKRMRPFLLVQAYKGFAKNPSENIYRPSTCVEFLHNASLIHDDIIDRDDTRRGNPAFHFLFKKFYIDSKFAFATPEHYGTTMGILGGDSTFFLGLEALQASFPAALNEKAIALYCKAYHEICDGVLMEMNFVQVPSVTEAQYMKMVSLKTGALIEKSLLIGATYGEASEDSKALLSTYAINLGKAFQIKDDILGTFGDAQKTGKPTDGDIKDGKKTLLLLKAIEKAKAVDKAFLKKTLGQPGITADQVDKVRKIFKDSGAEDYCARKIAEHSDMANVANDKLGNVMKTEQKDALKALVKYNLDRDK
nr:polyprenyl synthetase family protein [Candidatus Sigynarchaeota archaeon]